MKVLSILLALVNMLAAGLLLLACISVSNLNWEGMGWLGVRVATGMLVIWTGLLTFRDGTQPVSPEKMLAAGLMLILLGASCAMWGVHLTIVSGDVKNVVILFGSSLVLQGLASVIGVAQDMGAMTA